MPFLSAPLLLAPVVLAPSPDGEEDSVRSVAILVYEGVELLDFAGPGEVFSAVHGDAGHAFRVFTIARSLEPVTSQGFVEVTPRHTFADAPIPDIVVVPGGSIPISDRELIHWLERCSEESEVVMSVCNGALALAAAGLLDGREVTTHHGSLDALQTMAPEAIVSTNRRFVDSGKIVTSAGVSAGIDGALHLVTRLVGEGAAQETARYMEYEWRPDEIAELHAQPSRRLGDGANQVVARLREHGLEGALAWYAELEDAPRESLMNRAGYGLLAAGRTEDALLLLALVAASHPGSANAADSFSHALEEVGRVAEARSEARRGLEQLKTGEVEEARRRLLENALASRLARLDGDTERLVWACAPCGMSCDEKRYLLATSCPDCRGSMVRADAATYE